MGILDDEIVKWPFGVAASLVVAAAGYWIWWKQKQSENQSRHDQYRREVYREVWTTLQAAEVTIRGSAKTAIASLDTLVRDVNAVLMKNEIVLEPDDLALAREYLQAAIRLADVIREFGSEAEKEELARTGAVSNSTVVIARATQDFLVSRENVLSRATKAQLGS
jgi:hypothetical protein